jgi:hypothetical protein
VTTRHGPLYSSGALGCTIQNGIPKVGILMEDVYTLAETCRFRILTQEQLAADCEYVFVLCVLNKLFSFTYFRPWTLATDDASPISQAVGEFGGTARIGRLCTTSMSMNWG